MRAHGDLVRQPTIEEVTGMEMWDAIISLVFIISTLAKIHSMGKILRKRS